MQKLGVIWTAAAKAAAAKAALKKATPAKVTAIAVAVTPLVKELVATGVPVKTAIAQVSSEATRAVAAPPVVEPTPAPAPAVTVKTGTLVALVKDLVSTGVPEKTAISLVAAHAAKSQLAPKEKARKEQESLNAEWNKAKITLDPNIRDGSISITLLRKTAVKVRYIIYNPDTKLYSAVSTKPASLVNAEKLKAEQDRLKAEQNGLKSRWAKAAYTSDPNIKVSGKDWIIYNPDTDKFSIATKEPESLAALKKEKQQKELKSAWDKAETTSDPNIKSDKGRDNKEEWIIYNPDTKLYSTAGIKPASLRALEDKKRQEVLKSAWDKAEEMSVPNVRRVFDEKAIPQIYRYFIYDTSTQRYAVTTILPAGARPIRQVAESVAPIVQDMVSAGVPQAAAVAAVAAEAASQIAATTVVVPPVEPAPVPAEPEPPAVTAAITPLVNTMIAAGITEDKAIEMATAGAAQIIDAANEPDKQVQTEEVASAFAPVIKGLVDSGMTVEAAEKEAADAAGAVIGTQEPKKYTGLIIGGVIVAAVGTGIYFATRKK